MNKSSISLVILILSLAFPEVWAEDYYVSTNGCDTFPGTRERPVATLHMALRRVREFRRLSDKTTDISINLLDNNVFLLNEQIAIRPEDSGTPEHPLIIQSGNEGATISGGITVSDWHNEGKFLVANVPEWNGYPVDFRQFYVDRDKAVRAQDVTDYEQMSRILSLDKKNRILYVPATPALRKIAKQGVGHTEMVLHEMWCISNLRIKSIDIQGDSAAIQFHEPESRIQWEHPWPSPMTGTHPSAFYLTNHKSLLDEPGEWYHDLNAHKLYYYPKDQAERNEILQGRTKCRIPVLETLLSIEGTPERPVHDILIRGIKFEESTWMRPSISGHVPLQAGMYLLDGYKLRPQMIRPDRNHKLDNQAFCGRPGAAVKVCNAHDVILDGCQFCNLASTGLDFGEFTQQCIVANCTFTHIGGSAIVAGSFGPESYEGHLPYRPADKRQLCDGLIIANNWIESVGQEDWGTLGIAAGYVSNALIAYNTIQDVPYSGISLGWGWTQSVNCMEGNEVYRNRITHYASHMYDVAGIYTLSAQPKTFITENAVDSICHPSYVHDPNHWFNLYCDEGSSFITMQDNWCPSEKFLRNANGPCNTWENNGPMVDDSIRTNAGCQLEKMNDVAVPRIAISDIQKIRAKLQTRKPKK